MKLTPREPTPEMVEAERVKFAAWIVTQGWTEAPTARENGSYVNGALQARWLGWKARALHDAAPSVPSVEQELLEDLRFQLLAAANYIDALGGDSKSYRAAIARAKGE